MRYRFTYFALNQNDRYQSVFVVYICRRLDQTEKCRNSYNTRADIVLYTGSLKEGKNTFI